ncbi:MAG: hypothetical protein KVP17_000155 [Porospora cf. gigantea B]|uniref:uncharacterized protein n=1 Tax=Porospora cf. gigantea B TaxID=2853592 RepID=UPI003571B7C8|nr:MAG: hypothetical protein KVP17_000155 [Porospora cf. gigantea B]
MKLLSTAICFTVGLGAKCVPAAFPLPSPRFRADVSVDDIWVAAANFECGPNAVVLRYVAAQPRYVNANLRQSDPSNPPQIELACVNRAQLTVSGEGSCHSGCPTNPANWENHQELRTQRCSGPDWLEFASVKTVPVESNVDEESQLQCVSPLMMRDVVALSAVQPGTEVLRLIQQTLNQDACTTLGWRSVPQEGTDVLDVEVGCFVDRGLNPIYRGTCDSASCDVSWFKGAEPEFSCGSAFGFQTFKRSHLLQVFRETAGAECVAALQSMDSASIDRSCVLPTTTSNSTTTTAVTTTRRLVNHGLIWGLSIAGATGFLAMMAAFYGLFMMNKRKEPSEPTDEVS